MKAEVLSTRIDNDTKVAFNNVCNEVGLSPSQAIKIFAKAVINYGGIPFDVKAKQPTPATLNPIQALEKGPDNKADNVKHLFNELNES